MLIRLYLRTLCSHCMNLFSVKPDGVIDDVENVEKKWRGKNTLDIPTTWFGFPFFPTLPCCVVLLLAHFSFLILFSLTFSFLFSIWLGRSVGRSVGPVVDDAIFSTESDDCPFSGPASQLGRLGRMAGGQDRCLR